MRMIFSPYHTPDLRAWPPLMRWLEEHGLDPHEVKIVELLNDQPEMIVTRYINKPDGKRLLETVEVDDVSLTRCVLRVDRMPIHSLPPDRDLEAAS